MPPTKQTTPKSVGQCQHFLLILTPELKERIKKESENMFGKRKGAISLYVEQAMRVYLRMKIEGVNET